MTKQRLREALNEADHIALDGGAKYYDLVNLFEAVKEQYALYNEHGKAIKNNFDETPVYKSLPLVAGKWSDNALYMDLKIFPKRCLHSFQALPSANRALG